MADTLADGKASDFDAVVWTTESGWTTGGSTSLGRRTRMDPIQHERGVTPAAGFYMLALPWQRRRPSPLLGWVARNAEFLAERMSTTDSSTTASGAR